MRKSLFISLVFWLANSFTVGAQQSNFWFFGDHAGVNFNTYPPTIATNGQVNTIGTGTSASMCDSTGALLFYTDGETVFNRNHQVMFNGTGLWGDKECSNSVYVVRKPGSYHLYYIITTDAYLNPVIPWHGLAYSIVDINLNTGLGAVIQKNVQLVSQQSEQMAVVRHSNGIDVWIIFKEGQLNNTFRSYKLTCNGIDTSFISSTPSNFFISTTMWYWAAMKASPDGKKIAVVRTNTRTYDLYDFNNSTGVLSNGVQIPLPPHGPSAVYPNFYGLEFSPNSKKLYATTTYTYDNINFHGVLYQYDITIHDSTAINQSKFLIDSSSKEKYDIQLGPDDVIYGTHYYDSTLFAIKNPNATGSLCNYSDTAIRFNGRVVMVGLTRVLNDYLVNPKLTFFTSSSADCRTISFTANPLIPGLTNFKWTFGDGSSGIGQTVVHTFPSTGLGYVVSLSASHTDTCIGTTSCMQVIKFNPLNPEAKFGFSTTCGSKSVSFFDSSFVNPGTITSWQWDFGDGNQSNSQNPVHTYLNYGQYPIRLIVTASDACGTKDTITRSVTVSPKPESKFGYSGGCVSTLVPFKDSSTILAGNIIKWEWNFGGNGTSFLQNPDHNYATTGTHTVTLIVTGSNNCTDTVTKPVIITNKPVAKAGVTGGCVYMQTLFTDSSTLGSGNINNWYWESGIPGINSRYQNPSFVYTSPGTYTLKLAVTSDGLCSSDTIYKQVLIENKPNASFSTAIVCGDKNVNFSNLSTPTSGNITAYYWSFGTGSSTLANPGFSFSTFGDHIVKLTASTANGCVADTFQQTIKVIDKPNPTFTLPTICLLDGIANFQNNTTIQDGSVISYKWFFGDNTVLPAGSDTSIAIHGQYNYPAANNYFVKLVATTSNGCKDSLTRSFTVNGAVPVSDFRILNPLSLCVNKDVEIKDSSTVNFGDITRIKIYWGDGDSTIDNSPLQAPNGKIYSHRYAYFGTPANKSFTILEEAYSGTLCINSKTRIITVHAAPEIQFNPIPEICQEASSFQLTSASEKWGLSGSFIYSGNGITGTDIFNPGLAGVGQHTITYHFATNMGCTADSIRTITVNPSPISNFQMSSACLPNANINFTSNSLLPAGNSSTLNLSWNFDDPASTASNPNTASGANVSHVFNVYDTFFVKLQAISPKGCIDDTIIRLLPGVNLYQQPVSRFELDSSKLFCEGNSTTFINKSDSVGSGLQKIIWIFGDGNGDSTYKRTITHLYSPGSYIATLAVQNSNGCRSVPFPATILIESIPVARFGFDTICLGKPIQFSDSSTNSFGSINSWIWNFGDGGNSNLQSPTHTYTLYQNYFVSLRVRTMNGCESIPASSSLAVARVLVSAGRDTTGLKNQPIQLLGSGAKQYEWFPAQGLNNSLIANPIAKLQADQLYILKGITEGGCIGYDSVLIRIFSKADIYVPTAFTPNGDGKNDSFGPICIGIRKLERFVVYNRGGEIVYQTSNFNGKWDGTYRNRLQDSGTFVWTAMGYTHDGRKIEKQGTVILIR